MNCWIYRSSRRDGMYLYLAVEDDMAAVPDELMRQFGAPSRVMALELSPARPLARVDVAKVIDALETDGFYLQLPPNLRPDLYFGD